MGNVQINLDFELYTSAKVALKYLFGTKKILGVISSITTEA